MKRCKMICMFLAIVMVFSLFACDKTDQNTQPEQSGQPAQSAQPQQTPSSPQNSPSGGNSVPAASKPSKVTIGISGGLGRFLDYSFPSQNIHASDIVYDSLFLTDPATKQPYSRILADWGYIDDLTFVMTLKPGITFTNGEEATAEDLLFSILQHFERNTVGLNWIGPLDTENSTTDGAYTVTLKYHEPFGPGLFNNLFYLFDKSWSQEVGWDSQDWYNNPNGTGPYVVTEYVTDDHMTLKLKDNYWNAANEEFAVEEWVIRNYPDASTMMMALEVGDIDMTYLSVTDYERLLASGNEDIGVKLCSMGCNMNFHISPGNNEVFKDINVREALAYGVDWEAIGRMVMGELYVQSTSSLVKDSPFYLNVGPYQYDPERAKQVLKDAGYEPGDIKIHIYSMPSEQYKTLNEALQFYCQEMGITVDLEFGDVTSALSVWMQDGGSDAGWFSFISGSLPREPHHSWSAVYVKGFTWAFTDDQEVIDKGLAALHTVDKDKRIAMYHELQQIIRDRYIMYPVYEDMSVVAFWKDVFTQEEIDEFAFSHSYFALHGLSLAR